MIAWLTGWPVGSTVEAILITIAGMVLCMDDFKLARIWFTACAAWAAFCLFGSEHAATLTPTQHLSVEIIGSLLIAALWWTAMSYITTRIRKKREEREEFNLKLQAVVGTALEKHSEGKPSNDGATGAIPLPAPVAPVMLNGGFVQFESQSIVVPDTENAQRLTCGDLHVGEIIRVKFTFANRGQRPTLDTQTWGTIAIVEVAKNPGDRLRDVMLAGIKEGYEKFKNSGNSLGVGMVGHNFAQSLPLTQENINDLKSGAMRLHILLGGAWTDELGAEYFWTRAEWTDWPQVPLDQSLWRDA